MQLQRYGVVLDRLAEEHLETVRLWRTSPEISRFMIYRDPITPEMQHAWFASLDPDKDFYFVVEYQGDRCGLANIKSVNWNDKSFSTGIFMTPEYWGTDVPFRAAFSVSDFAFEDLGLEVNYCQVLKNNARALRFNRALGYRIIGQEDSEAGIFEMRRNKRDYEEATAGLRKYLLQGFASTLAPP